MLYRAAKSFPVAGAWLFYPELLCARNVHNGTIAQCFSVKDGWAIYCVNCPADWMLESLAEWFGKWATGKVD